MADTKITALAAITTVDPAADVLPIVDISDTSMAASGTTKKITSNQILGSGGTATLASATITGDLTVDTSTLKVDSTNNRVGIGTASPALPFVVSNAGAQGFEINPNGSIVSGGIDILSYNRSTSVYKGIGFAAESYLFRVGTVSATDAMTLNSTGLGVGGSPNISASGKAVTISGTFTRSRLELQNTDGGSGGVTCGSISWFNGSNLIADITGAANSGSATLGSLAFSTGGSTRLTIDSSGNVGIGVTSPTYKLQAAVTSGADRSIFAAQIAGASNGFEILWNHATTTTRVIITSIPTSAAGLAAGTLWNDAGTIKIA